MDESTDKAPEAWAPRAIRPREPPPRLGEHSDEVLRELLGLTDAEIADLKAADVTGAVL